MSDEPLRGGYVARLGGDRPGDSVVLGVAQGLMDDPPHSAEDTPVAYSNTEKLVLVRMYADRIKAFYSTGARAEKQQLKAIIARIDQLVDSLDCLPHGAIKAD